MALDKLSFSKQKSSQSTSIQLQVAMNVLYDLMMQCLHCLRNVHDRTTLFICRQMISSKTLSCIFSYHYPYIIFCKWQMPFRKSSMKLVWKYGRLPSIPFLKSSIPFHSGIFHIPYRKFCSIPFSIFHSIPFHALFITQWHV